MSMTVHNADSLRALSERLHSLVTSVGPGRNALYSLVEYAVIPILYLAATPYFIRHLGLDMYGIWILINSMIGLAGAFDFGLGDATIRFVALNRGRENRAGIVQAIKVAFLVVTSLSGVASLAAFSFAPFFVERLFTIPANLSTVAIQSVQIGAILLVIRMIESMFASVFRGYERYDIAVGASVGVRGLTLCSAVVVTYLGLDLQAILTTSMYVSIIGLLAQGVLTRRLVRSTPGKTLLQENQWQEMCRFGIYAWLQTITWVVFSHADRLIIGSLLGTAALAVYSVCLQLAQPIHGVIAAGFAAMFPAVSRRIGSSGISSVRRDVQDLMKLNVVCALALAIPLLFLSGPFLALWMGPDFMMQGTTLLQWLVVACLFQAVQVVPHFILLASGEMKYLSMNSLIGMGMTLGVTVLLVPAIGLTGAVLGRFAGGAAGCALFPRMATILRPNLQPAEAARPAGPMIADTADRWGVTLVICSHNGAARLRETLAHLAAQQVPAELPWEVLLVDNASTDATAATAQACWPAEAPVRLRILYESLPGLTHARCRGFAEARYAFVSFIDDDNWICPDWVRLAADLMQRRPDVGACGGYVEAQCEISPPWWFEQYRPYYAVGTQSEQEGDVTWSRGYLWGAGLTVRKSAWTQLQRKGFHFLLNDRVGNNLHSGGDAELCLALRLAGWTLWYEPRLTMRHFVPAARLQWGYLKQVVRGFGIASPAHKAYYAVRENVDRGLYIRLRANWLCQLSACSFRLLQQAVRLAVFPPVREGNPAVLEFESLLGTITQLWRTRRAYDANFWKIRKMFENVAIH